MARVGVNDHAKRAAPKLRKARALRARREPQTFARALEVELRAQERAVAIRRADAVVFVEQPSDPHAVLERRKHVELDELGSETARRSGRALQERHHAARAREERRRAERRRDIGEISPRKNAPRRPLEPTTAR